MQSIKPESILIISMQPDDQKEREYCQKLAVALGAQVHEVRSLQELSSALSGCSQLVTERYHGALAGMTMGIPVEIVSQVSGDKLDQLRREKRSVGELRELVRRGEEALRSALRLSIRE